MELPFQSGQSWGEKVLEADKIWAQVKSALDEAGLSLPTTPRRPDIRMILDNNTGKQLSFRNPGDHSGSKPEQIPASGDKKATMIMIKGDSLQDQYKNARHLFEIYNLAAEGMSERFITDMEAGKLNDLVDEAYGPAPFEGQTEKLVDLEWHGATGDVTKIHPVKGFCGSFGARAATDESVFLVRFPIYVKGSGTTPELVESAGMNIAISADWQTGAESTRPIVPSVAPIYYGQYIDSIPEVIASPDGTVHVVDLKNGTILTPSVKASKPNSRAKNPRP